MSRMAGRIALERASSTAGRDHVGEREAVARNVRAVVETGAVAASHVERRASAPARAAVEVRALVAAVAVDPGMRIGDVRAQGILQDLGKSVGCDVPVGQAREPHARDGRSVHAEMDGVLLHMAGLPIGLG